MPHKRTSDGKSEIDKYKKLATYNCGMEVFKIDTEVQSTERMAMKESRRNEMNGHNKKACRRKEHETKHEEKQVMMSPVGVFRARIREDNRLCALRKELTSEKMNVGSTAGGSELEIPKFVGPSHLKTRGM
jgi:hypothetical protein